MNGELDKAQLQQEIAKRNEIIDKQQSTIRDREEIHRQLDEQIQRQTLEILRFNEQLKDAQVFLFFFFQIEKRKIETIDVLSN